MTFFLNGVEIQLFLVFTTVLEYVIKSFFKSLKSFFGVTPCIKDSQITLIYMYMCDTSKQTAVFNQSLFSFQPVNTNNYQKLFSISIFSIVKIILLI